MRNQQRVCSICREPAMAPGSMRQIRDVTEGSWLKQSKPVAHRDAHRWILLPAGQSNRHSGQEGNVWLHKCDNPIKGAGKCSLDGHHFTGREVKLGGTREQIRPTLDHPPWIYGC